ncbi:MAG: Hpt domain-containing protein [Acetobacterales bacterium]
MASQNATVKTGDVLEPSEDLKRKVRVGGPGAVDDLVLQRAEKVVEDMAEDYLEWVKGDLTNLQKAIESAASEPEAWRSHVDDAFHVAHDMKGQGGSFNYMLVTAIAKQLCEFLESVEKFGAKETATAKLHVDALRLVLGKRLTGDGGKVGRQLLGGLGMVIKKIGPAPRDAESTPEGEAN